MKKKSFYLIFLIVFILALLCILGSLNSEKLEFDFWVIPISYLIIELIFIEDIKKEKYSYGIITFEIIAFVRYVILAVLYYFNNESNYIYDTKFDIIVMMIIELFFCKLVIHFFLKKNSNVKLTEFSYNNIIVYCFIGIFTIISICFPIFLTPWKSMFTNENIEIDSFLIILYRLSAVVLNLFLINKISKINLISNNKKILISIIVSVFLGTISSINMSNGNISRWSICIYIISFLVLLIKVFPKYKKKILIYIIFFMTIILVISTYFKNNQHEYDVRREQKTFKEIISKNFEFNTINTYFSGYYQIDMAQKTKMIFQNSINATTFVNDIFMNFPKLNHLLDTTNNIFTYFNYSYYNGYVSQDQICPMIGVGYIYFGFILSPLLSIITTFFLCYISNKIRGKMNSFKYYYLVFTSIYFGIFMCINMNIIFQFIWGKMLPLGIVYLLCSKINYKKERG